MHDLVTLIGQRQDFVQAMGLMLLVTARLIFAIFFTPAFGGRTIPTTVKMATCAACVVMLYPAISESLPQPLPTAAMPLILLFIKECFVGLLLGMILSLIFFGIQAAGQFVDDQRGESMAVIFNPALASQASLTSQLFFQMAVVLFFITGGHRVYLSGLFQSFEVLPIVSYPHLDLIFLDETLQLMIKVSGNVLLVCVQLAAPIIISMFLAEVVLGVANRIAPQMDVLFMSYTVKAMAGLIIIFFALQYISFQMIRLFEGHLRWFQELLRTLSPG